ncbi:NADPH-dependent FMN reductase [Microbacterium sp. CJ88]|uniref:NADPH-dependent FMN reductase n=1 Tax=Microbacterium sp. CJ88 TaxID=3445672 RepID=UPI003F654F40
MTVRTVGVIVGSVSTDSLNRRYAEGLATLAGRAGLEFVDISIDQLPFFGTQFQDDFPPEGLAYKAALHAVDGLLMVTPEYNRSIPAVLKNAIDWASRPVGESVFPDLPIAVTGASRGVISTAVAQNHLKAILTSQGAAVVGRPEVYLRVTDETFAPDGGFADDKTVQFMLGFLQALHAQIVRFRPA